MSTRTARACSVTEEEEEEEEEEPSGGGGGRRSWKNLSMRSREKSSFVFEEAMEPLKDDDDDDDDDDVADRAASARLSKKWKPI